ncbi:hypothetical protein SLEP1_g51371 [Rubroshorea leprosula]|uniref:Uncharacterized protein n=1 Tax=Rubroshorea leprosula TaxID=152421 RepID=A0AAV5M322_9ROSI|nr:hypothetical protein SLEP1_g51371 [Rubroshorea leprosula]
MKPRAHGQHQIGGTPKMPNFLASSSYRFCNFNTVINKVCRNSCGDTVWLFR